jgi:hypothetical protein
MNLDFDLEQVRVTEFGVGLDAGSEPTFVEVSVDADVQGALREMVQATWVAMQEHEDGPTKYEPSEKHAATEYVFLPLDDDLTSAVRDLHRANNLDLRATALDAPEGLFCYFARLIDKRRRRLTALRRATQFKGVLKKRLIRLLSDSLVLIEDRVFKLDNDFDLLVDSTNVHILRPSGFEFAGKLQQAILAAVPQNAKAIQDCLRFVQFSSVEEYASQHPRAARYLSSIRGQEGLKQTSKALLKKLCKETGVGLIESNGRLTVQSGHVMGFLEVLDRRRYQISLVEAKPERYRAASRKKISG